MAFTGPTAGDFISGGIVSTSSTTVAVRATANLTEPTGARQCQGVQFQQVTGNTDVVYICTTATPTLTGTMEGVLLVMREAADTSVPLPVYVVGNPSGAGPINAAELYVLGAVADEGLLVTILGPTT